MIHWQISWKVLLLLQLVFWTTPVVRVDGADRLPNIVFILADDLGYGDLGCYGQTKIQTPNIDRLAQHGMRFTQHYSGSPVCAPSRCVLMTGLHSGHAQVRDNVEVQPESQFPLMENTQTLARLLQQKGYKTGAFGKWGLGGAGTSGDPLRQGFDRFFGYNCQRIAHNYYPTSLWDNLSRVTLKNPTFSAHQQLAKDADANEARNYQSYSGKEYAPDRIADEAFRFIEENRESPFFLYFPSTIPHLALQVPDDALAPYLGEFPEEPYRGDRYYLPHRTPRAAYAAMVSRLDQHVGKILQRLHDLDLESNTIVIFASDNGPLYDRIGGTDTDFFQSAGKFRGRKGSVYEGGVRVPAIVCWPGHIAQNSVSDRVTGFEDWLPTLLELIGTAAPQNIDGISFAATLHSQQQPERPYLYREFPAYEGQQSVRVGEWKAVRQNLKPKSGKPQIKTELYNIARDPEETADVSAAHPEIVERLEKILREQHRPSEGFPFPALDK